MKASTMRINVAVFVAWCALVCVVKSELPSESNIRVLPLDSYHDINYDVLLNVARNGLPQAKTKKKIIIVGAGMAGLTAAYTLQQAGHEVAILEASDRVGGGILTYRDKAGWQAELGAMRIPETHRLLLYYIRDLFQLQLEQVILSDPETYFYFNGIRKKCKEYLKDPDSLGFNTSLEEKGKTVEELVEPFFKPYADELQLKGWKKFVNTYDHMSLYEFLLQKTNLSESAVQMFGKLFNIDNFWHFSFTANLESYYRFADLDFFTVPTGMDNIPKSFLKVLKETKIIFNSRVSKVTQGAHNVVVGYSRGFESEKYDMTADFLIMTASAPCVSFIEFHPQLSLGKRSSLRDIHQDHVTKIVLAFSARFWEDEGIRGGKSITDLPSRVFYYFPGNSGFAGGVVMSYTWAHDSQLLTGLSEKDCLHIALDNLAVIHGQHIRQFYIGGTVKHWLLDQFTLGAYPFPLPLQRSKILDAFHENDGRVWFAGGYTDTEYSWIETSVKSGLRAAINVNTFASDDVVKQELYGSKTEL